LSNPWRLSWGLNRLGRRTGRGHTWTESRVRAFRGTHDIAVYQEGERLARGELTLEETAKTLKISTESVRRLIAQKVLVERGGLSGGYKPRTVLWNTVDEFCRVGTCPPQRHHDRLRQEPRPRFSAQGPVFAIVRYGPGWLPYRLWRQRAPDWSGGGEMEI
jgi:hypothetical protein